MPNVDKVYKFYKNYPGYLKTSSKKIAKKLNVTLSDVLRARDLIEGRAVRVVTNANDRALDKVEEAGLSKDFDSFLEKHNLTKEDVTNVWFKEKASGTYFSVETRKTKSDLSEIDITEEFKQSIKEYVPPSYSKPHQSKLYKRTAIINLFDAHLDKISSTDVTDENSTVEGNIYQFERSYEEILSSIAEKNPEKIIIPIGNDFWHTNDDKGQTKRGTYVGGATNMDHRLAFRIGLNLIRRTIDKARLVAPVKIITVLGNHDTDKTMYLLECLLLAYENQEDVEIVDSRKTRQYHRYGAWLFGFAHGDKIQNSKDYPSLMSTDLDAKKHWSDIKQGIFFLGHRHHEIRHDYRGCSVLYLRSENPIDEWHWEKGYTAMRKTAYGFIYEFDGSREYEFKVNI